jgi:hypothetical protein
LELLRLDELELHLFTKTQPAWLSYFSDDQATRRYQDGHYNTAQISAVIDGHTVRVDITETGAYPTGTVRFSPVLYGCQGDWQAVITHNGVVEQRALRPAVRSWVCQRLSVLAC